MSLRTPDDVLADIGDAFSSACAARNSSRALQVAVGVFEELTEAIRFSDSKRTLASGHLGTLAGGFSGTAFYSGLPQLSEEVYSLFGNHVAGLIKSDNPKVTEAGIGLARNMVSRCNMWLGSDIKYENHFVTDVFTLQFYLILKTIGVESPHFPELFLAYKNSVSLILLTADREASARGITFIGDILLLAQAIPDPPLRKQRLVSLLGDCHRMLWSILGPTAHGAAGNVHNWRVKRHAITALCDYPRLAIENNVAQLAKDCLFLFYDACYRDAVLLEACRYRLVQTVASVIEAKGDQSRELYQDQILKLIELCIQDSRPLFQVQNIVWMANLVKAAVAVKDVALLEKLLTRAVSGILKVAEEQPSYYALIRHFAVASFVFLSIHGFRDIGKKFVLSSAKPGEPLSINSEMVRAVVKEYYGQDISNESIDAVMRSSFRPKSS